MPKKSRQKLIIEANKKFFSEGESDFKEFYKTFQNTYFYITLIVFLLPWK